MPSFSHACMRPRAAVSPGSNGSGTSSGSPSASGDGISPTFTFEGKASVRGAPWTSRRSSCVHARQNGENTAYGLPALVRGLPTSATNSPGWRTGATPASSSAAHTRLSRAIANGDTSEAKWTVSAPRLARERRELPRRVAGAHDEVGAAVAQRGAQLAQAAEQEAGARARLEAPAQQRVVEHEHGDDALGLAGGGGQGRVVVDAQVAPEPDDRGLGHRW